MRRVFKGGGGVRFNLKRGQVGLFAGERKEGICGGGGQVYGYEKGQTDILSGTEGEQGYKDGGGQT